MKQQAPLFLVLGVSFSVMLLTLGVIGKAQDTFKDVPSGNWAYGAISDLQRNDILVGYPDGFFAGKRILTRYEFALALKRTIERVIPISLTALGKSAGSGGEGDAPPLDPDQVQSIRRLVDEFSKDLAGLQVNVPRVRLRLRAMTLYVGSLNSRLDAAAKTHTGLLQGVHVDPDPPQSFFTGLAVGPNHLPLISNSSTLANAFSVTSRMGSATTTLFANGSFGSTNYFTGDVFSRSSAGFVGEPLAIAPPIPDYTVVPLTQNGSVANRAAGLNLTVPIFNAGSVGGTVIDFSNPAGDTMPAGEVFVGGVNFNLNPIGRMNVSGQASRSIAQFDPGGDAENNAFNLNLRYGSGPVDVLGGFQYIDPGYEAPGVWNSLGMISNLTNVQGPFVRVNYNLNPRTQFQLGSDLLAGARNRSYNFGGGLTTGFGTHDFISTLSAGMQYKLWHSTSLTADWEGVYWDLSATSSGLGVEAHPFESYINLGTGINLRGNAMLKMGYQIGSFGNFSGFGGLGPSGSGQTYNAFTTQLNVKF